MARQRVGRCVCRTDSDFVYFVSLEAHFTSLVVCQAEAQERGQCMVYYRARVNGSGGGGGGTIV